MLASVHSLGPAADDGTRTHEATQPLLTAAAPALQPVDTSTRPIPPESPSTAKLPATHKRSPSTTLKRQRSRKYRFRSALNILGSVSFTGLYCVIIWYYINSPVENGIAKNFIVDAKVIFYLWFLLSVFALDWAHSATAVIEIAALKSRYFAPQTAMHFMWHSERSWGGPTGWMKAVVSTLVQFTKGFRTSQMSLHARRPARLWWLLTLVNIPLWIAVPLSGLSFDFSTASVSDTRPVEIYGVNQTTFELRSSSFLWQTAMERWSQGHTTTPSGPSILYAPQSVGEASDTYYYDAIRKPDDSDSVVFFSGPAVSERAEGPTWGVWVRVSAKAVPVDDLRMIHASSFQHWNLTSLAKSSQYTRLDTMYGCGSALLVASNGSLQPAYSDDGNHARSKRSGSARHDLNQEAVEILLWQYYNETFVISDDPTVNAMVKDPIVRAEPLSDAGLSAESQVPGFPQKQYVFSYGLSLQIDSAVGYAKVSAKTATFSNFTVSPSLPGSSIEQTIEKMREVLNASCRWINNTGLTPYDTCEILIQSDQALNLLLQPITAAGGRILSISDLLLGALTCLKLDSLLDQATYTNMRSASCLNPWLAANVATGGQPYQIIDLITVPGLNGVLEDKKIPLPYLRLPLLVPSRMRLAMLKLIGELAIAMTGAGPEPYNTNMTGFREITILKPGIIPWQLIVALLVLWNVLFVGMTALFFTHTRFAPALGAYHLFRFGTEWRDDLVHDKMGVDFVEADGLSKIPTASDLSTAVKREEYGFLGITLAKLSARFGARKTW
jgi:hypothetical protein